MTEATRQTKLLTEMTVPELRMLRDQGRDDARRLGWTYVDLEAVENLLALVDPA